MTADFTRPAARATSACRSPELFDFARASGLFEEIAGVWPISANLTEVDEPERVETALVDAGYFSMLGVARRSSGASSTPRRQQPGIAEVAVISDALWQRRFGGDPACSAADPHRQRLYTIVGVLPRGFPPSRARH